MGEYRAQAIPMAWLNDEAIRYQIEADLLAAAKQAQGDSPHQTREIYYSQHENPAYCTPVIRWTNHE